MKRVVLVGAESTGKTTLCQRLAERFKTNWVAEYGREYTIHKYEDALGKADITAFEASELPAWTADEFVEIARAQQLREDEAAGLANRVLICDTDAFATAIWFDRYMGGPWPAELERLAMDAPGDLYLVTHPDFPFVQDGIRDGEQIREWMHQRFLDALQVKGAIFEVLAGGPEDRFRQAVDLIEGMLTGK